MPVTLTSDPSPLRVPLAAAAFSAVQNTPAMTSGGANRWPVLAFDAATQEIAAAVTEVPTGWSTYHADLYWTNLGAGAGDVVWRLDRIQTGGADTEAITSPSGTGTQAAVTAPAQNVTKVTRLGTSVAVTPSKPLVVNVVRLAADAGDTLANDAGFFYVLLTKAS